MSPSDGPSLRTTRSRTNPTVTLYSLDPQSVPVEAASRMRFNSDEVHAIKEEETDAKSRFFAGSMSRTQKGQSTSSDTGKRFRLGADGSPHVKRQKLDDKSGGTKAEPASPTSSFSSTSTLSPPPQVGDVAAPDPIKVKPEPPSTPLRRVTRNKAGSVLVGSSMESTPMRTVKDEDATPARKTPKIKNETTAKPRPSTPIKLKLDKPHPEPPRWRRQYELIEKMREKIVAPVDTL